MNEIKYLETHEWYIMVGESITVGISAYAQGELGDIVFVTMPAVGDTFQKGSPVVELEATKTIAEVYAPFDCEITEINEKPMKCNLFYNYYQLHSLLLTSSITDNKY